MFTFGVCKHCHLEYSQFRYRLYSKWQCLQTPNVNILSNTLGLGIDGILYLNLNPISQSQSELLRMHVKTRKTSDYNNVQKELIYVLFITVDSCMKYLKNHLVVSVSVKGCSHSAIATASFYRNKWVLMKSM